ncbi:putative H/ACA ribonucleoprotein complex subunit 1 [Iris pallida]|uniref:H/ACA ribonucleoprotein complex subunit 1 n=1 Tax=Iris pallida TaxID=29817 RepID=A0AAX6H3Z5_IRIPA|nr:putative H/ACA ribonucleoprotein complex subunit 1 [Iris pallida]
MGSAISRGVMVAESVKRKVAGLHQNTLIGSTDISYIWEAPEGSLAPLETTHHVSMITITLSRKELDTSSSGYQSPIPAGQINPSREFSYDGELLPSESGRGINVHGGCDGRGTDKGNVNEVPDDNANRGWGARHGYAGRGRGRGRNQAFQVQGRHNGEIFGVYDKESRLQESGNINGVPDLSVNGISDAGPGYADRGRGRDQAFQGQVTGHSGEIGAANERENRRQESGNINMVADLSVNGGSDARPGYADRARGRGRNQTFQGRGRGYSGEIDGGYGRGNMHGEPVGWDINGVPDLSSNEASHVRPDYAVRGRGRGRGRGRNQTFQGRGRGYSGETGFGFGRGNMHQESGDINGVPDLSINGGLDARPGYVERGSGRGRDQTFQGRGRGYSGEVGGGYGRGNMHEESGNINGVPDLSSNGASHARPGYAVRGRGRGRNQTFQGRGRGYSGETGFGYGRGNMHQESGDINRVPDLSINGGLDARPGYAERGSGQGRDQTFQGRGRGRSDEVGGGCGRGNMHEESGNTNVMPDRTVNRVLNDTHGYAGRGRRRRRTRGFHGRGGFVGGYGNRNTHQEPSGSEEFNGSEASTQEKDVGSSEQNDDSAEQEQHLDNMETPLDVGQLPPSDDNLPCGSISLAFDDLSDADITRIGSACGFVFSGNGIQAVALIRSLEKQRAKVCATW